MLALGATPPTGAIRPVVEPQTSTGSRMAKSMSSIPRFVNFAILASVPASTMMLVMTLCAWRLYKGIIIRRPLPEEVETEEKDVTEEYMDASDRLDVVRDKGLFEVGV